MSPPRRWRGWLRRLALLTALVVVAGVPAAPTSAAPRVAVTSALGSGVVSADEPTTVTVSGSGFQSIAGGFGGVYVFFGWVSDPSGGSWRPSQGGRTGEHYLYVPDSEARDNQGYQRFVTFPGSSTAEAANGGELAADGTFGFSMVIPGPRFAARDRTGNVQEVDCLQVTCGIITTGAHGVVNASNESFTPLQFTGSGSEGGTAGSDAGAADSEASTTGAEQRGEAAPEAAQDGSAGATAAAPGADAVAGEPAGEDPPETVAVPALTGPATVGVDQGTIVAGRVLAFTGQGFAPGEQVMATLGAGYAVAGPLSAGEYGEVVGTFALPQDVRVGTHLLRLSGAASGESPQVEVTVVADPALPAAQAATSPADPWWSWAFVIAVVTAALLALVLLTGLVTAIRRRRATRTAGADQDTPDDGTAAVTASGTTPTSADRATDADAPAAAVSTG